MDTQRTALCNEASVARDVSPRSSFDVDKPVPHDLVCKVGREKPVHLELKSQSFKAVLVATGSLKVGHEDLPAP